MIVTSYLFGLIWPFLANPTAMYINTAQESLDVLGQGTYLQALLNQHCKISTLKRSRKAHLYVLCAFLWFSINSGLNNPDFLNGYCKGGSLLGYIFLWDYTKKHNFSLDNLQLLKNNNNKLEIKLYLCLWQLLLLIDCFWILDFKSLDLTKLKTKTKST